MLDNRLASTQYRRDHGELTPDLYNALQYIRKATPIDYEFAQALEGTLVSEWLSEYDEEAYRDL